LGFIRRGRRASEKHEIARERSFLNCGGALREPRSVISRLKRSSRTLSTSRRRGISLAIRCNHRPLTARIHTHYHAQVLPGAAWATWGPGVVVATSASTSASTSAAAAAAAAAAASLRVGDTGSLPRLVQLLHGVECPAGTYSVTLALLGLVEGLVRACCALTQVRVRVRANPNPRLATPALTLTLTPTLNPNGRCAAACARSRCRRCWRTRYGRCWCRSRAGGSNTACTAGRWRRPRCVCWPPHWHRYNHTLDTSHPLARSMPKLTVRQVAKSQHRSALIAP